MISLFSHAISALLSKLFDKWTNSYIDRENEENSYRKSVRVSRTLGIVGGIWLILFAAFGVLGIIIWADDMTDWDSFACGILFLFISLLGIFCMLFRRNYRIFYTDTFVEKHSTFGKKQVYHWAELLSVQQKGAVYTLTFPPENSALFPARSMLAVISLSIFLKKKYFLKKRLDKSFVL